MFDSIQTTFFKVLCYYIILKHNSQDNPCYPSSF